MHVNAHTHEADGTITMAELMSVITHRRTSTYGAAEVLLRTNGELTAA